MMITGDEKSRAALSVAGKKGVSHKIQLKDLNTARRAEKLAKDAADIAAQEEEQAKLYIVNSEGDVLPPDGSIPLEK